MRAERGRGPVLLLGALALGAIDCAEPAVAPAAVPVGTGLDLAREPTDERPPRRPDAVVLEPEPALPAPVEDAPASGIVALREPLGEGAVRAVVRAVIDAWVRESVDQLALLLTSDAGPIEARARGRGPLVDAWRQRLHAHEYKRLAGVDLVHPERIEHYGWRELSAPSAVPRPAEMRPEELYVRVPLEVTRIGGERLFGDVILLLLRREGSRYLVSAYGEI